jgi:hypothetical protein
MMTDKEKRICAKAAFLSIWTVSAIHLMTKIPLILHTLNGGNSGYGAKQVITFGVYLSLSVFIMGVIGFLESRNDGR